MKANIKEDGNKIIVEVSIPGRTRPRDPSLVIDTKKVLEFLRNNGYNDIKSYSLIKEGLCSTLSVNQILKSEWVFEKLKPERRRSEKQTKSSKPTTTRRRTRKTSTKSKEDKLL